jgi:hypothetical protein
MSVVLGYKVFFLALIPIVRKYNMDTFSYIRLHCGTAMIPDDSDGGVDGGVDA